VPIGTYSLGAGAARSLPDIRQLVVRRPAALQGGGAAGDDAFERLLYLVRKRLEKRLAPPAGAPPEATTYIPSFSHRTVVYKGLVLAPNLRHLFPDLNDSDFQSAIALFHQRYATNTFPMWAGSQPFRMLAHNGEINTLQGNTKWMTMREETLSSPVWGPAIKDLVPVIQPTGSDSAMLDNVLELLVMSGRTPIQAVAMLVPEAYENDKAMDARTRAFFDYQRTLMEPWDGPAALCFTDGRTVAAALDRNGLRPLRYWVTSAGKLIAGSEVGIVDVPSERVVLRGKLGPGDMLAVDTVRGVVVKNAEIKAALAAKRPYQAWLERSINHVGEGAQGLGQIMSYASLLKVLGPGEAAALLTTAPPAADAAAAPPPPQPPAPVPAAVTAAVEARVRLKKAFGYAKEDEELILKPMMDSAHEPIGSMGDDTPIAAFSAKPQLLYRYFKQRFAEVTNPPIDPLLERAVMSLNITFGRKGKLLQEDAGASFLLRLRSPVLTESQLNWLLGHELFANERIDCTFAVAGGEGGLAAGLAAVCAAVEAAVDRGVSYMVLSDMGVSAARAPIPMLLAVGAVHSHLLAVRKRMKATLICETGEAREDHHVAALISYGASLVYPKLAYETVVELAAERLRAGDAAAPTIERSLANYRTALQDGLLRIMSKMGISTVDSYRGSQTHEILGLDAALVERYFAGSTARLSCVTIEKLAADALAFHAAGYGEPVEFKRGTALPRSGAYAPAKGGERHDWNPLVFNKLRAATQTDKFETYKKFAAEVDARPLTSLRDALEWVPAAAPVPLAEVEPVEEIVKRFSTQAMSHGSIGREAHEALAIAANRLGSRSNTGEGGEDPDRYQGAAGYAADRPDIGFSETWHPRAGDDGNSRIKQVASGRFGVTPTYLVNAEQLEIKMAQGSKPGAWPNKK
jgi:glutamate synthase domain-containing protein 1